MNKLLWHLELPGVEGLVVRDVALCLGDGDNHVVPLLAINLLCRDGPLEMVLLEERRKQLFRIDYLQFEDRCKDSHFLFRDILTLASEYQNITFLYYLITICDMIILL